MLLVQSAQAQGHHNSAALCGVYTLQQLGRARAEHEAQSHEDARSERDAEHSVQQQAARVGGGQLVLRVRARALQRGGAAALGAQARAQRQRLSVAHV
jgi:hypothetical protein